MYYTIGWRIRVISFLLVYNPDPIRDPGVRFNSVCIGLLLICYTFAIDHLGLPFTLKTTALPSLT